MICSIVGCSKPTHSRGWCQTHYRRWWEHGDPEFVKFKRARNGAPDEFLRVAAAYLGNDCIFWPFASSSSGYGQIGVGDGKRQLVHRIICEKIRGPAPWDKPVSAHSCGNGHLGCITPVHLRWATNLENASDMILHGRSTRGEKCPTSKLTDELVLEIHRRATYGRSTQRDIAAEFGIAQTLVSMIKLGKRWGWLTGVSK